MTETFDIAGYARISVDDEQDQKNISIENQKAIIEDYVKTHFPGSTLTFFEDRDRSGYTFEQREGYQEMRRGLMSHKYDILIIKDFSRFSRRNSRGLVELEDLRDAGVRIISIGDNIDFPNDDDWLKIQFQFLVNEMPVTDTSRKVRNVIKRRQNDGEWICAAPYGYLVTEDKQFEIIPTEAETVRRIFDLYSNAGWGYKKIANYLTDQGVPTPRMSERMRKEAAGKKTKREAKNAWAIATVQGILDNDFYIGTLRQGKYTRAKINGKEIKRNDDEHIVIENHHQAIIDYRTFAITSALREKRSRNNYRGVKINDNVYSGFLQCGDCGSPLFAMSRSDLAPAYTCGTYHRRGLKGCTSHHIRVDRLDELLKSYVRKLADSSSAMLAQLNEELKRENDQVAETEQSADNLAAVLADLTEELKVTKRQRIREIMKKPEQEASIEALYDEMEADLQKKIDGINHQIDLLSDATSSSGGRTTASGSAPRPTAILSPRTSSLRSSPRKPRPSAGFLTSTATPVGATRKSPTISPIRAFPRRACPSGCARKRRARKRNGKPKTPGPSPRCRAFWTTIFISARSGRASIPAPRSTARRSNATTMSISSLKTIIRPSSTTAPSPSPALCGKSAAAITIAASKSTTMCTPVFCSAATAAVRCLP